MVNYLKQKAKVTINRKPRTKYEISEALKKRKLNESSLSMSQLQPQAEEEKSGAKTDKKNITPTILEKYDIDMKKNN